MDPIRIEIGDNAATIISNAADGSIIELASGVNLGNVIITNKSLTFQMEEDAADNAVINSMAIAGNEDNPANVTLSGEGISFGTGSFTGGPSSIIYVSGNSTTLTANNLQMTGTGTQAGILVDNGGSVVVNGSTLSGLASGIRTNGNVNVELNGTTLDGNTTHIDVNNADADTSIAAKTGTSLTNSTAEAINIHKAADSEDSVLVIEPGVTISGNQTNLAFEGEATIGNVSQTNPTMTITGPANLAEGGQSQITVSISAVYGKGALTGEVVLISGNGDAVLTGATFSIAEGQTSATITMDLPPDGSFNPGRSAVFGVQNVAFQTPDPDNAAEFTLPVTNLTVAYGNDEADPNAGGGGGSGDSDNDGGSSGGSSDDNGGNDNSGGGGTPTSTNTTTVIGSSSITVPAGVNITPVTSPSQDKNAALADLGNRLIAGDPVSQGQQTNAAQDWTSSLPEGTQVEVHTITLTATDPSTPVTITIDSSNGAGATTQTAYIIDASGLPAGSVVNLDNVPFAVISGPATLGGGAGQNYVVADGSAQNITLGEGNDTLFGGAGNDNIGSTTGKDVVLGNQGEDTVFGGEDEDVLYGGQDEDIVFGNQGADFAYGNMGDDTVYGGQDEDTIYGGQDDDLIYGNLAKDRVHGNKGNDTVYGGQGDDAVYGEEGDDALFGNKGDDTVVGGEGNDTISGGDGNNTLVGGEGDDTFILGYKGRATILDFGNGDVLILQQGGDNIVDLTALFRHEVIQAGGGAVDVSFEHGDIDVENRHNNPVIDDGWGLG